MTISRETFLQQCKRRFGTANPERMRLAHWEWMVRTRNDPFRVRNEMGIAEELEYPLHDTHVPDWCFARIGQSRTRMPDGRIICIGGEHEDWGDENFCIYNDVIMLRPAAGAADVTVDSGDVEIFSYPESVFPPTDFHSANLVREQIYIIGAIGYPAARRAGVTPAYMLDARDYRIKPLETLGSPPGWIYKHYSSYDPALHAITVRGGARHPDACDDDHPAPTAYRLHLADLRWEALPPNGPDQRFMLRAPRSVVHRHPLAALPLPLRPSMPHELLDPPDFYPDHIRIGVQSYRITFSDEITGVGVRIEGRLSRETVDALLQGLSTKLLTETGVRWEIGPWEP